MFLRPNQRTKDGKTHTYWNVVENRRLGNGKIVQRQVLYLGEISSAQTELWQRAISDVTGPGKPSHGTPLLPDRASHIDVPPIQVRLSQMRLCRPRQFGSCWLALQLWRDLGLDRFFAEKLLPNRKGTRWDEVLQVLVAYRLIQPGSEWKLHRDWYDKSAMADLLGADFGLASRHKLYECHNRLLPFKDELFSHLTGRWRDMFNASFEVLLYDLTSTYFESDAADLPEGDKRRHGYSRDKRSDCPQVVIALVVTPDGLPLAYEVLPGNTSDKTTLRAFLDKIEAQYGKARRVWVMDRGIPTEEVLAAMRKSDPPIQYLVGTPKGRLNKLEKKLLDKPWQQARQGVEVKLLKEEDELYVFAHSHDRSAKERAMRKRKLKWLWKRLHEIAAMRQNREQMLMRLGAARAKDKAAWNLLDVQIDPKAASFTFALNRSKLRHAMRREGRYLLRTNLAETDPAVLWRYYVQLTVVEGAFKNLKDDLAIRPVYHHLEQRIEAHIFISFLAYCLYITLHKRLQPLASGLTARSALEKFAAVQMLDVIIPTSDGRDLILTRHTEPEPELRLLLERMHLELPPQPPPRIAAVTATPIDAVV